MTSLPTTLYPALHNKLRPHPTHSIHSLANFRLLHRRLHRRRHTPCTKPEVPEVAAILPPCHNEKKDPPSSLLYKYPVSWLERRPAQGRHCGSEQLRIGTEPLARSFVRSLIHLLAPHGLHYATLICPLTPSQGRGKVTD